MKKYYIFFILIVIYSCNKEQANLDLNGNFYLRDEISSNLFNKINKGITNDSTLIKVINHFKDFNKKSNIANKIESEFGMPVWNLSISMKDKNGLYITFTPVVNNFNSVTALIIASEKNKKTTFFRVINKKISQSKLAKFGDGDANSFTLYSLNGIFSALQENVEIFKKGMQEAEELKIISNSISNSRNSIVKNQIESLTYVTCWLYITADENYNTLIKYQCVTNIIYFEIGGVDGSGSNNLTPTYTGFGGVELSEKEIFIDESLLINLIGPTPIKLYKSICLGVNSMWNNYPNNETHGYITFDGQLLFTNITNFNGGSVAGLYQYENIYYYPYPKTGGDIGVPGTKATANYFLVPVIASIHTHTPCRIDNTDGISNRAVSDDDMNFSLKYPGLINYVLGCEVIANFSENNSEYYNVKTSAQSNLCNFILK